MYGLTTIAKLNRQAAEAAEIMARHAAPKPTPAPQTPEKK